MAESVGQGGLQIRAYTASQAQPVSGATVTISTISPDNEQPQLLYALTTDSSGITPQVVLAAPARSTSESPGQRTPYAEYRVEITKEGFYPVIFEGIAIFDGVITDQPTALLPVLDSTVPIQPQVYPPYSNQL